MMQRLLILLLFALQAVCGFAQSPEQAPIVRVEVAEEEVTVGQPVILRVTLLVPTWMPSPPEFPSFEAPNLILRLPQRASGPVSETIDGETWSGISRAYRLYPMVPGPFVLSPQPLRITYADPDTRTPVKAEIQIPDIRFAAVVPEGAEGLDPLIVAQSLSLSQEIEAPEGSLKEGDSLTRIVTAKIRGTSALFLPPMLTPVETQALSAYPREPRVSEESERGGLSGQRVEEVTYVAQYGGIVDLPAVRIEWFNTKTGKVETAELEGLAVTVEAPAPPREPILTRNQIVAMAALALVVALMIRPSRQWVFPLIGRTIAQLQAARLASERHAARRVRAAIRSRDLHAVSIAVLDWETHVVGSIESDRSAFDAAVLEIGAARYSEGGIENWRDVERTFKAMRKARLRDLKTRRNAPSLPPLNPF